MMSMKGGWVYIITNRIFGTLYTGVTNNLVRRIREHRQGSGSGFAARYKLIRLVFSGWHDDLQSAIARETRLKHWPRRWKLNLIEAQNPEWNDPYPSLIV
jgi:putative endonuclease